MKSIALEVSIKDTDQFRLAMDLLKRAESYLSEQPPDSNWFRDLFRLNGEHMVLTEEGWQPGCEKQALIDEYGADYIQDEVNAPAPPEHRMRIRRAEIPVEGAVRARR